MRRGTTHRASQLTIIPIAFLAHNAEEALTIPAALPIAQAKLASMFSPTLQLPSAAQSYVMLLAITLTAFAVWLAAYWNESLCYALSVLQATLTVNIINHVGGALVLLGYSPEFVTSVTVEPAARVVVFSRLKRDNWLSRTQRLLLPARDHTENRCDEMLHLDAPFQVPRAATRLPLLGPSRASRDRGLTCNRASMMGSTWSWLHRDHT